MQTFMVLEVFSGVECPASLLPVALDGSLDLVEVHFDIFDVHVGRVQYTPELSSEKFPIGLFPVLVLLPNVVLLLIESLVESASVGSFDEQAREIAVNETDVQICTNVMDGPMRDRSALEPLVVP